MKNTAVFIVMTSLIGTALCQQMMLGSADFQNTLTQNFGVNRFMNPSQSSTFSAFGNTLTSNQFSSPSSQSFPNLGSFSNSIQSLMQLQNKMNPQSVNQIAPTNNQNSFNPAFIPQPISTSSFPSSINSFNPPFIPQGSSSFYANQPSISPKSLLSNSLNQQNQAFVNPIQQVLSNVNPTLPAG